MFSLFHLIEIADKHWVNDYAIEEVAFVDGAIRLTCCEDSVWTFPDQQVELDDDGTAMAKAATGETVCVSLMRCEPLTAKFLTEG